ncbi:MAG: DUF2927 domain-containing protein [Alphaproteobacteria bacterium]|nr:DUF2927 domain-containing protein [Alphaproteobacteria bacterium]
MRCQLHGGHNRCLMPVNSEGTLVQEPPRRCRLRSPPWAALVALWLLGGCATPGVGNADRTAEHLEVLALPSPASRLVKRGAVVVALVDTARALNDGLRAYVVDRLEQVIWPNTGLPVTILPASAGRTGANLVVEFTAEPLQGRFSPNFITDAICVANAQQVRVYTVLATGGSAGSLDQRVRQCFDHELLHALGLPGRASSIVGVPSIMLIDSGVQRGLTAPSEWDVTVLRALYDPRLKVGMYRSDLKPIAKQVVQEVLSGEHFLGRKIVPTLPVGASPLLIDFGQPPTAEMTARFGPLPRSSPELGIVAPADRPVLAAADGTVARADTDPRFGGTVEIDHPAPFLDQPNIVRTVYRGLRSPSVADGARVRRGQVVGEAGDLEAKGFAAILFGSKLVQAGVVD